jgi:hypothetical protein
MVLQGSWSRKRNGVSPGNSDRLELNGYEKAEEA